MKTEFNPRIKVFGSEQEVTNAIEVLTDNASRLIDGEVPDRLVLQELIEKHNLTANIVYQGNGVTPLTRTINDLKAVIEANDMYVMSEHLYKILTLRCGSIAHGDRDGWIAQYPTVQSLARFFRRNEFGENIAYHAPNWNSDFKVVAQEMLRLTEKLV
jgi:hypothetical protein